MLRTSDDENNATYIPTCKLFIYYLILKQHLTIHQVAQIPQGEQYLSLASITYNGNYMPFFSQQSSEMIANEGSVHDIGLLDHAVSSGDFRRVLDLKNQRNLTDNEKYHLLTSHFQPSSAYRFPLLQCGKQKHSFKHSWLSHHNGLVYSELDKGGYCKYYILFGQSAFSVPNLTGTLISHPLTNIQKASEKLREHFEGIGNGKYHLAAVERAEGFKAVMECNVIPVDQQLWLT